MDFAKITRNAEKRNCAKKKKEAEEKKKADAKWDKEYNEVHLPAEMNRFEQALTILANAGKKSWLCEIEFCSDVRDGKLYKKIEEYCKANNIKFTDASYPFKFSGSDESPEVDCFKTQVWLNWAPCKKCKGVGYTEWTRPAFGSAYCECAVDTISDYSYGIRYWKLSSWEPKKVRSMTLGPCRDVLGIDEVLVHRVTSVPLKGCVRDRFSPIERAEIEGP